MQINEIIRKTGKNKWTVFSHKGHPMGTYGSLDAAKRRLHQIEYFKHLKEGAETPVNKSDLKRALVSMKDLLKGASKRQLHQGFNDEKEHDNGSKIDVIKGSHKERAEKLLKIVLAHLKEKPDYYDRLKMAMKK